MESGHAVLNDERNAENLQHHTRLAKNVETFFVFAGMCMALGLASGSFGLTWDEASYFRFADSVRDWFVNGHGLAHATILKYWGYSFYHNPHPPFLKAVNAFFSHLFSGVLPYPTSYRMTNIFYVSGCAAIAYRLLVSSFSSPAALAGIAFACLQPRVFGHLMIAATDSPVAMSWLAITLTAWKLSRESVSGKRRAALWALLFMLLGVAAAAKITGFIVVVPLAAYFVFKRDYSQLRWLFWGSVYALLFVALTSPTMWPHPLDGIGAYLTYPFLRSHEAISTFYLGKIYKFHLPWHYFTVMTLVTFPVLLLLLLPAGLFRMGKPERHGLAHALVFPVAFWVLITALPITPKHDGIRQFLSIYPFLGLLAWLGLLYILSVAKKLSGHVFVKYAGKWCGLAASAVLAILVWANHPFELSYYNCLIGGMQGAQKRGMEISYYWDAANPDFMRSVNRYLQNGATVYMVPQWDWLLDCYSDHGVLDGTYTVLGRRTSAFPDYFLVLRRLSYINDRFYRAINPLVEVTWHGVSLVKFGTLPKPGPKTDGGSHP